MRNTYTAAYQRMLRRLVEARKEAGLTQLQVGKALRMRQTLVSKIEVGERRLDAIELARFARLYGKPLEYFVQL